MKRLLGFICFVCLMLMMGSCAPHNWFLMNSEGYMFKANFGGKNIHRTGSWDVPLKPVYRCYSAAEKLRAFWHKKIIKKLKGR